MYPEKYSKKSDDKVESKDFKKTKKKGSKSKGPRDSRKINKSQRYDKVSTDTATNSVDWYVTNEQMLKDAASIQFFNALGNETYYGRNSQFLTQYVGPTNVTFTDTSKLDRSVPGIFKIGYLPTYGRARDNSDPINLAARNIYSFVRKANSGSKNYDAPNMMMYLMACDSVYTFYQWMLRLYGLLRYYSVYNQYYNEAILKAMNVDAASFSGFMADFRAYINKFALKANSLCVPNTFKVYERHMYLVSALFKDTEAAKAQIYLFNPDYIYTYDEPNGRLTPLAIGRNASLLTPTDVMAIGDTLLNAILTSEDMAIIKGDILKAFGDNGIYSLAPISDDYVTATIHDYEILTEIQASNYLGPLDLSKANINITEDTTPGSATEGALRQSVTSAVTYTTSGAKNFVPTGNLATILNMYVDNPTPADVMVASRLAHYSVLYIDGDASAATVYNTAEYYGTEVCTTFSMWALDANHVGQALVLGSLSEFTNAQSNYASVMGALSAFEWHPVFMGASPTVTLAATPTLDVTYLGVINFDWDNYTTVNFAVLARLHECAVLGEFRIPQMGILM